MQEGFPSRTFVGFASFIACANMGVNLKFSCSQGFLVFARNWKCGRRSRCAHTMCMRTCVPVVVCVARKLRPCPSYSGQRVYGAKLRSKDPPPLPGLSCHDTAIEDLTDLTRVLNVPMPNTDKLLPKAIFNHSGAMLSHVQAVATRLSEVAIVRIVDKSPGTMWGLCRQWIWDETTQFLRSTKRYTDTSRPPAEVLSGLCDLVRGKGWACHDRARLALLYLIGKGKSLALPGITFRPICAPSATVIPRWRLRIAARAFTCFLKTLAQEIPGSFLHLSIQGVAHWMTYLNTWNCTHCAWRGSLQGSVQTYFA